MTAEVAPHAGEAAWSADLDWVLQALWGRTDGVRVTPPGELDGRRVVDGFAVLPSASHPRLLVPLGSGRAAARAVRDHASHRRLLRIAKPVIAGGMRSGVGRRLVRDRVAVSVNAGEPAGNLPDLLLKDHLKQVLGRDDLETAVKFDAPRPHRKPTIQVLSRDGEVLAFVKVGWNELTTTLVRAEADALQMLERPRLQSLEVPRVLHAGPWQELELLVLAPLAIGGAHKKRTLLDTPPTAATREISRMFETARGPLSGSSWWAQVNRRLGATETALHERSGLRDAAAEIERRWGDTELGFGFCHGDWVPANMSAGRDRVSVWDWERAAPLTPYGLDAIHFEFQVALGQDGLSPLAAVPHLLSRECSSLTALRIPESHRPLLLALHLLEMSLRFDEARAAGVQMLDRKYRLPLATLLSASD